MIQMFSTRKISLVLVLGAVLLAACSSESADPKAYSNSGDTIRVAQGGQFKIVLESNPSTGYGWQFTTPFDSTHLTLVEKTYEPLPNPEKLVGRGGHDHWLFEAVGKGRTELSMRYLRPWDTTTVEKTVEFTVEIAE